MADLHWYDWIGVVGTLMVLLAYFLLQAGRLHGNRVLYQALNLFGAIGVLASLYGTFNLAVLLLMVAWVAISAYGLVRSIKQSSAPTSPST